MGEEGGRRRRRGRGRLDVRKGRIHCKVDWAWSGRGIRKRTLFLFSRDSSRTYNTIRPTRLNSDCFLLSSSLFRKLAYVLYTCVASSFTTVTRTTKHSDAIPRPLHFLHTSHPSPLNIREDRASSLLQVLTLPLCLVARCLASL